VIIALGWQKNNGTVVAVEEDVRLVLVVDDRFEICRKKLCHEFYPTASL